MKSEVLQPTLFTSKFVQDRELVIYLPPSYQTCTKQYPVLYMHDGQMLFDSTTTWNGQEWGVDEKMDQLIKDGIIRETIVVGIYNGGTELRHPEYFPQKPFESLTQETRDALYAINRDRAYPLFAHNVQSDNYLKFIVDELKPHIDANYRTLPDQTNTFMGGSSMGGLISLYAICEYPQIFGGAMCMSTHWPGIFAAENNPVPDAFFNYMTKSLPHPDHHKFYFDYGTETLDAMYSPFQPVADSIIKSKGYTKENFATKKFEGAAHDERSWSERLHIPLTFLLKK